MSTLKRHIAGIHYAKTLSAEDSILRSFLRFFSFFYGIATKFRNKLFDYKILKTKKLDAYVISIGNLTTGGTGKTPITVKAASYLTNELGKKVAIISRGYGGKLSVDKVNIISDGKNVFHSAQMAGDEPYLMAKNTNDTPIITAQNRYFSGQRAISEFGTEVIIMDDGYQHRKLYRDMNIMIVDCYNKFGNQMLLPAGPLRESIEELKRADKIIVVNKQPFDEKSKVDANNFAHELQNKYQIPVFVCQFENTGIFNLKTGESISPESRVYAFAGIGQPEFFFGYLNDLNFDIVKAREFNDHHLYTKDDIQNIIKEAKKLGANSIVTTEKDAVKLKAFLSEMDLDIALYTLKLGISLDIEKILEELK